MPHEDHGEKDAIYEVAEVMGQHIRLVELPGAGWLPRERFEKVELDQ